MVEKVHGGNRQYIPGVFDTFKREVRLAKWFGFPELMNDLGFQMDTGKSFNEYKETCGLKYAKPQTKIEEQRNNLYLLEQADISIVGNYAFSHWRYLSYWTLEYDENDVKYLLDVISILEKKMNEQSISNTQNLDEKIIQFVYVESIRDAVLQLAYRGQKSWLEDISLFPESMAAIKQFIQNILAGQYHSIEEYNKDFLKTAIVLCDEINTQGGNTEFSFGNAQKLINLMVKYFYISSYGDKQKKQYFTYCHCPMDSILLGKIWAQRARLNASVVRKMNSRAAFLKSWGQEDFEMVQGERHIPSRYLVFQEAVRMIAGKESLSPLEYDYCSWQDKP